MVESTMDLSPISLSGSDEPCEGGIICELLKSCDSPIHQPSPDRFLPESPESLASPSEPVPVRKRKISSDSEDEIPLSKSAKIRLERDGPLSIETDSDSDGEPEAKRVRRRVPTRTSGALPMGLYIPPKNYYAHEDFKHTCIDDRIELGPQYDCPMCQWKHLIKPVKPVLERLSVSSKHVLLKKLRVEHPIHPNKFVKVRTKSALSVEGEFYCFVFRERVFIGLIRRTEITK